MVIHRNIISACSSSLHIIYGTPAANQAIVNGPLGDLSGCIPGRSKSAHPYAQFTARCNMCMELAIKVGTVESLGILKRPV